MESEQQSKSWCAIQVDPNGNANFTIQADGSQLSNYTQSSSPDFTSLLPVRADTNLPWPVCKPP